MAIFRVKPILQTKSRPFLGGFQILRQPPFERSSHGLLP
jgi:hypothetical protein